jgi:uncharacterized OsmC-like protein
MTTTPETLRNGVDTTAFFATIDAVKGDHDIAKFRFRASNTWVTGTHSRSTIDGFHGALSELHHSPVHIYDADHPAVLTGQDRGATPVEFLLHALAACLTAGIANIAAARGVELVSVETTVDGDIDLLGILGLGGDDVRNGFERIAVRLRIAGDDPERLRQVVEQSRNRSAVYDVLTNGVPVSIEVEAG